jgi:hypothetical protein
MIAVESVAASTARAARTTVVGNQLDPTQRAEEEEDGFVWGVWRSGRDFNPNL